MLLLTAAIWGFAFVAQSVGMDYLGPFTFNAVRSLIGGITLLPFIALSVRKEDGKKGAAKPDAVARRPVLRNTSVCSQQSAADRDSVYNCGQGGIYHGVLYRARSGTRYSAEKEDRPESLGGCRDCSCGTLLSVYDGEIHCGKRGRVSVPGRGTFALHILVIDHFSPRADGVRMACIQFFTCGLLSSVPMFLLETPKVSDILQAWAPILYAGVLSCGVAYTLQILGQKNVSPTIASLILSLESCISVLAGFIILGEKLSARELSGCVLMFGAIILAQIPEKKKTLQEARNEESACSS